MCARFTFKHSKREVEEFFGLINVPDAPARYNIAPSQDVSVVRPTVGGGDREWVSLRWGLVPSWAKPGTPQAAAGLVNAKAETAADKPAFREAFRSRRCLVPADGFYEWETVAGKRQPNWFHLADEGMFAFAGIWEPPAAGSKSPAETVAIITTTANADIRPVHDRMPVILFPEQFAQWLDPATSDNELSVVLRPLPDGLLVSHPVSMAVNKSTADGAGLLSPVRAGLFG